jgi:hypothetical protein
LSDQKATPSATPPYRRPLLELEESTPGITEEVEV